jgi:uncharacterized protein (TIGR03790 family)
MPGLRRAIWISTLILLVASVALAGGGPQNVLVVANEESEDSLAVANAYLAARGIPNTNLCRLAIPVAEFRGQKIIKADRFEALVVAPLKAFLARHPAPDQLHFLVLCPDLPLRVEFPAPVGPRSLSATLTLLGAAPAANQKMNPYHQQPGAFDRLPSGDDAIARQRLVTVLAGYERRDGLDLIARSLAADGTAPKGAFHFVPSQHTRLYEEAVAWLKGRGFEAVLGEKGKPLADVKDVMAYFSGGSYSGLTTASVARNTYRPGAVADMLESYGAEWPNWKGFALLRQVPVAWFIRSGITGVHGTTDEPYAAAFPSSGYSQIFFAHYTTGGNLAEAFWSAIPTLQWQNAVFGDPLCAPYAVRPKVVIDRADAASVNVTVFHSGAPAPREAQLFVDGRLLVTAKELTAKDTGTSTASFGLETAALVPGTHRVRVVAVDASPQAVQGWATADVVVAAAEAAPAIALAESKLELAAGDTVQVTCSRRDASGATKIELWAGAISLGTFAGESLSVPTSRLGIGVHELQARAIDASGKLVALSNFLKLPLVEPLHVVTSLPGDATGPQPMLYFRYSAPLAMAEDVVRKAVRLDQGGKVAAVQVSVNGADLVVEPVRPLRIGEPCTLTIRLPQSVARSRDVVRQFTPSPDLRLLYTLPADVRDASTVQGLVSSDGRSVSPIWKNPAAVVLGPVDLYSPDRPARWTLPSCSVSAQLTITKDARPEGKDQAGAGVGIMYSDINNRCYARIERQAVVLYQVLAGQSKSLASWPIPGDKTVGTFVLEVFGRGPQVSVMLDGTMLGQANVDRTLPPGLPWIDLGAATGVSARDVKVCR